MILAVFMTHLRYQVFISVRKSGIRLFCFFKFTLKLMINSKSFSKNENGKA